MYFGDSYDPLNGQNILPQKIIGFFNNVDNENIV